MATFNWIGKEKVMIHHRDVPYLVLNHSFGFNSENPLDKAYTNSGNMIIHGDNLLALKALLPQYEGRIKCIYIDPPYNTGNEKWVYNDNVNDPHIRKWLGEVVGPQGEDYSRHDKWLCMMYPRLVLLRELLSTEGVIFISIDDNEYQNLKILCDEIFGANNLINNFVWYTEGHTDNQDVITHVHEYILCYAKNVSNVHIRHIVDPNIPEDSKILRSFAENSITKNGFKNAPSIVQLPVGFPCEIDRLYLKKSERCDDFYQATKDTYITREATKEYNMSYPVRLDEMKVEKGHLSQPCRVFSGWMNAGKLRSFIANGCKPIEEEAGTNLFFYLSKNGVIYYRRSGRQSHYVQSVLQNMGTTEKNKYILEAMGVSFDYPKPIELISYLLSLFTNDGDIVLDSFAGSGSTAHALMELDKSEGLHRKFILVELNDYAETLTAYRVISAMTGFGKKDKYIPGIPGAFDYFELGEPLFNQNNCLNESVGEDVIREYIYYSETKRPLTRPHLDGEYILDTFDQVGYYFYYRKGEATVLSVDTLSIVTEKAESYVIYADICNLSESFLVKHNIVFKQIPRDIKHF